MAINIAVDDRDRPGREHLLADIEAATSSMTPSSQPNFSILARKQWEQQYTGEANGIHHNAWLAPDTSPSDRSVPIISPRSAENWSGHDEDFRAGD